MKKAWPKLLAVILAAAAGACGGNHPLSGTGMGAPTGPALGSDGMGAAGSGAAGTGVAGATGTGVVGAGPQPLKISGSEALRRIAAVLWNEQPDDDLGRLAAQGSLATTKDLENAVRQMLADPRAAVGVGAFYRWWLDLDRVAALTKDARLFPAFTPALQADMADETTRFAVDVTLDMNGTYQTLLTAPFTYLNARLADLYGVPNVTGDDLRPRPVDPSQRAGLLTQPSLQALSSLGTRTAPSHRGGQID